MCAGIQINTNAEINNPSKTIVFDIAVYPINAGIAPENPPSIMFDRFFLLRYALYTIK